MAVHDSIRIKFEVEGRQFEAVGFLHENELYVLGDEMLRRTAMENGGVIKGEDEAFLRERSAQLPTELDPYLLVTGERNPKESQFVLCFDRKHYSWDWLGYLFGPRCLVVRRCS